MSQPLGVYLHVPFCRTRCRYCDFYRVGENAARKREFLAALGREIDAAPELAGRTIDTVFFGGGTPSLLAPEAIADVLERLARRATIAAGAEITLEANPSDADVGRLTGWRAAGIDRLSLGVQSFRDRELALLGRRHDGRDAARCVDAARSAGFANLSLDLMLAVPGQTAAGFAATLERAIALAPDHLSLYLLEVHPRSEIDALRRRRPGLFPGEEAERRRYLAAAARLAGVGYEHYEVSNFALPGRRSRHNLKYWRCRPVLGFGPAAHSLVGGRRWRNPPDLVAYLADPGTREAVPSDLGEERVFLGLRLRDGVTATEIRAATGLSAAALADRLERLAGLAEASSGRVGLTREGLILMTTALGELLAEPAPHERPAANPPGAAVRSGLVPVGGGE